jgi:DNA anti-recombination protein RmuC
VGYREAVAIERIGKAISTKDSSIADLLSQVGKELNHLNRTLARFLEIEEERIRERAEAIEHIRQQVDSTP